MGADARQRTKAHTGMDKGAHEIAHGDARERTKGRTRAHKRTHESAQGVARASTCDGNTGTHRKVEKHKEEGVHIHVDVQSLCPRRGVCAEELASEVGLVLS